MLGPDGAFNSDLYSEGATMTMPRRELFLHLGGPHDGERLFVELDADGTPVEFYVFNDMTDVDMSRNPTTEIMADRVRVTYQRESRLGDGGFEYIYRYVGTDVLGSSEAA